MNIKRSSKVKRAILSDIHGNLEALTAVMKDIEEQKVDEIFCLGDVIGYGANPLECLDIIMEKAKVCLLGNHEQGALYDPEGFNQRAVRAIIWTRKQLETESEKRDVRWHFLNMRPRKFEDPAWNALFVHGSPKNPLNEYVFPDDVNDAPKMEIFWGLTKHICFQGHTHVPGVFVDGRFDSPNDLSPEFELDLVPGKKYMINVGSVGQPRDSNTNACYVIAEGESFEETIHLTYRRIQYPIQEAADKIFQVNELDQFFGNRLLEGR